MRVGTALHYVIEELDVSSCRNVIQYFQGIVMSSTWWTSGIDALVIGATGVYTMVKQPVKSFSIVSEISGGH